MDQAGGCVPGNGTLQKELSKICYCLFFEVLCRSLGVEAKPNNGTWERVRGMFRKIRKIKKLEANKRRKIE